ncbi:hypothetical protein RSW78_26840, partial [Escherichia coli]|uniref:hypothetical protein n=1 Tax=Escherichia coli TaxID=562 RepID=UPI0028DF1BF9
DTPTAAGKEDQFALPLLDPPISPYARERLLLGAFEYPIITKLNSESTKFFPLYWPHSTVKGGKEAVVLNAHAMRACMG